MDIYTPKPTANFINSSPGIIEDRITQEDYLTLPDSTDPAVSKKASQQLVANGCLPIQKLTKALRTDIDHVAINAAKRIGDFGPLAKNSVFDLIWMLRHSSTIRRGIAAATLGRIKSIPRVSVYALAKALRDCELTVRQYASAALGEFKGDELKCVLQELDRATHDSDKNVRIFAKYALSKIQGF